MDGMVGIENGMYGKYRYHVFEFEIIIWNAFRHFQTNIDTLTARKDGARCLSLRRYGTVGR